jgi:two-component system chemotaxis response regulator CheY
VRRRVLVIEDDADVRSALADALAGAGVLPVVAVDGLDGLERLRAGPPPSAILLDLRMPRLGGAEFLRAMRADPRYEHVPVITMTAGSEPTDDHEVVAHLHKPFDLEDLLQIVLSLSESHAAA